MPYDDDEQFEEQMPDILVRAQPSAADPLLVEVRVEPPGPEHIAEAIARQWLGNYGIQKELRAAINARIEEMVSARVTAAIASSLEEILSAPRVRTDDLGNPISAPKTLLEMLNDSVKAWGAELVDEKGIVGKPDNYNRDRFKTRAEWSLQRTVSRELYEQIDKEAKTLTAQLKETIKGDLAKRMASHLTTLIK